ncbi:hypothetical protein K3495_g11061 [Podosphaera aphanis]|nr:hypothetical protein K3495_g11061 [Podosphaera aphanis]
MSNSTSNQPSQPSPNTKARKPPKRWDQDGVNGGPNSIDLLIDWITTSPNYARWKGNGSGETKEALCSEVVRCLQKNGIFHRKNQDIRSKICEFQTSYNDARDWSENIGKEIRQSGLEDAEKKFKEALKKICKHWDQLHPIFSDHAASQPVLVADSLGDVDGSSEKGEGNAPDSEETDLYLDQETGKRRALSRIVGEEPPNKKGKTSIAKAPTTLKPVSFEIQKEIQKEIMNEILESNERTRKAELEQKHRIQFAALAIEKNKVKLETMRLYHTMGYSKEDIFELVKEM